MARTRGRAARIKTHACATTTRRFRRAIQASEETNTALAERYGVNRKTIAKWKARESTSDDRMGPKNPCSSVLTRDDEAIILAFRWRTRLPLNDCLYKLRRRTPKLSRSALHRCLKRLGLGKIGRTYAGPPLTSASLEGPYTFEITVIEVTFFEGVIGMVLHVFLAVEEVTKQMYAEVRAATPEDAADFLAHLVAEFSQSILRVTTDILPIFTDWRAHFNEDMAEVSPHPFSVACRDNRIVHTRTIPPYQKPIEWKLPSATVDIQYYQPRGQSASLPARGW